MRPTSTAPSISVNSTGPMKANSSAAPPRQSAIMSVSLRMWRMLRANHGDSGGHRRGRSPTPEVPEVHGRDAERRGEGLGCLDGDVSFRGTAASAGRAAAYGDAGRALAKHATGGGHTGEAGGVLGRRIDSGRVAILEAAVLGTLAGALQHGRLLHAEAAEIDQPQHQQRENGQREGELEQEVTTAIGGKPRQICFRS